MTKYRNAALKLTMYDLADHAISDISQRLEAIDVAKKNERDLTDECKTLLQIRRYVKLADESRFVKGSKWQELQTKNTRFAKAANEHNHNIENNGQNEPQQQKCFK